MSHRSVMIVVSEYLSGISTGIADAGGEILHCHRAVLDQYAPFHASSPINHYIYESILAPIFICAHLHLFAQKNLHRRYTMFVLSSNKEHILCHIGALLFALILIRILELCTYWYGPLELDNNKYCPV